MYLGSWTGPGAGRNKIEWTNRVVIDDNNNILRMIGIRQRVWEKGQMGPWRPQRVREKIAQLIAFRGRRESGCTGAAGIIITVVC